MKLDVIYNEDCLEGMKRLPDKSFNLIIADPPYNIKKADWDRIPDYIDWSGKWILECQRVLKDNGSFYWFHNDMPTISRLMIWLEENSKFVFKQFIVWNKKFIGVKNEGYLQGYNEVEGLRNYQQMAEYLLFYTFQDETGLKQIYGNDLCFQSIQKYLRKELKKYGKANDINKLFWTNDWIKKNSNIATHFFGENSQNCLPTEINYKRLQTTGFFQKPYKKLRQEYEDLRQSYEGLRLKYESLRYVFNNQKTHHSVWNYEIAKKNVHLTPKPIPLIENILKYSSNKGDIILIPFVGGGNDCIACKRLSRYYIGYETNEGYYQITKQRLEAEKTLWD